MENAHTTHRTWLSRNPRRPERVRLELTPLESRLALSAGQTVINFDDLPAGTVVTTQYPGVTFSSADGYGNVTTSVNSQYGGSPPNSLGAFDPNTGSFNDPTFLKFTTPVSDLKFVAIGDNNSGDIGTVVVTQKDGTVTNVPIIGDGNFSTSILVDLSTFSNVSDIAISNSDPAGLAFDDFSFTGGTDYEANDLQWVTDNGGGLKFDYTVSGVSQQNVGAGKQAANAPKIAFYWSKDGTGDPGDLIGNPIYETTLKNENGDQTLTATLQQLHIKTGGAMQAGANYIVAVLDSQKTVKETSEDNNVGSWQWNLAGTGWFSRYNQDYFGSNQVSDLSDTFRPEVQSFLGALQEGGVPNPTISSTKRSYERQFIMYYAKQIADGKMDADEVQEITPTNIDIQWDYGNDNYSVAAAKALLGGQGFGIGTNPVGKPDQGSLHITGDAIDMNITGYKNKLVFVGPDATPWSEAHGYVEGLSLVKITDANTLYEIGATYGVIKLLSDPPHWSVNGH